MNFDWFFCHFPLLSLWRWAYIEPFSNLNEGIPSFLMSLSINLGSRSQKLPGRPTCKTKYLWVPLIYPNMSWSSYPILKVLLGQVAEPTKPHCQTSAAPGISSDYQYRQQQLGGLEVQRNICSLSDLTEAEIQVSHQQHCLSSRMSILFREWAFHWLRKGSPIIIIFSSCWWHF